MPRIWELRTVFGVLSPPLKKGVLNHKKSDSFWPVTHKNEAQNIQETDFLYFDFFQSLAGFISDIFEIF